MSKTDQETALIESAERLFHRQGYGATGARQIAVAAGVPQGSFTNHFRSKEALGVAALERYATRIAHIMGETLDAPDRPAGERLSRYFDRIEGLLAEGRWETGCLVPDLATEASACGERLRLRLVEVLHGQTAAFERVVGEIVPPDDASDLAAFVLAAWHGTLLRMKAERSGEPLTRFRRTLAKLLVDRPLL